LRSPIISPNSTIFACLISDEDRDNLNRAIAKGLDCDRRLGESIAVWQDGKVVILSADQIPIPDQETTRRI